MYETPYGLSSVKALNCKQMTDTVETLNLVGDRLCLDFVNTVNRLPSTGPDEFLTDVDALRAWAERVKLTPPEPYTDGLLEKALRLREALYRIFYAVAHSERVPEEDLETLKRVYLSTLEQARLEPSGSRFVWSIANNSPQALLHALAFDAMALLQSDLTERVRYCQNEACNWLFLDTSRSRTKRWCSAQGCGNRMRVKRFAERQRRSV